MYKSQKSLGIFAALSQKLVRLFLFAENGVVSLESAAQQLKTKMRRLYDIANILSSLQLIEKASAAERIRKPAFKWIYNESTFLLKACLVSKNLDILRSEIEVTGRKRGSQSISSTSGASKRHVPTNRATKRADIHEEQRSSEDSALDKLATVAQLMFTSTQPKSQMHAMPNFESNHDNSLETTAMQSYLTTKIASLQALLSQISQSQNTDNEKTGNRSVDNVPTSNLPAQISSSIETPLLQAPSICF